MDPIPLSEAVNELRKELKLALEQADDKLHLEVNEVELELSLDFSRQRGGGLKLSVPSLGGAEANAGSTTARLHRVKLLLSPTLAAEDGGQPGVLNLSSEEPDDGKW
ncbi:trypco2 family protein [Glycomyces sp. MUSA5-2]|uniref:trypco2 family protein n=1 Tax=Glycomyces sp. MUSA5-2 TaxID=2053002 RepID=UPI00300B23E6